MAISAGPTTLQEVPFVVMGMKGLLVCLILAPNSVPPGQLDFEQPVPLTMLVEKGGPLPSWSAKHPVMNCLNAGLVLLRGRLLGR